MVWWYGRYIRKTPAQQRSSIPFYFRIAVLSFITALIRKPLFYPIANKLKNAGFDNNQINLIDWSLVILNPLLGFMILLLTILTMRYIRR